MKQAILFLSDKSSPWILKNFNSLTAAANDTTDIYFLYHQRNNSIPEPLQKLNYFAFTDTILHELGYTPIEETLIPGSNHFPLLKFYLSHPDYEYYWVVEDDVYFNGNWEILFNSYLNAPADLLSTHIKKYAENPTWHWWDSFQTDTENLSRENFRSSFNPIYRLTNRALSCIDQALKNGWKGHHEVVFPTLLHYRGFTLLDMGGTGTYVPEGFENRFYREKDMSHLPMEPGDEPNYLYHPVKEKKIINMKKLNKNCVIAAVGKNSLHREWIQEEPDFDLHLIIYDNSYNKYYNDTNFICYQKGNKFNLIHEYLQQNPDYLKRYEYFFFPDDDIDIDTNNLGELFRIMKKYDLQIAQPALSDSYFTHDHTLRDSHCFLRYSNFVEMMAPCFSQEALHRVLFTFASNRCGWGIEYHWPELIGFTGKEMAIIDALYAVHTRPLQSQLLVNKIELDTYIEENNLSREIRETGCILSNPKTDRPSEEKITDRNTHSYLNAVISFLLKDILNSDDAFGSFSLGIYGLTGISLLMFQTNRTSEKKEYADLAFAMMEHSGALIESYRNNMSFDKGIPGYSWLIEYLAQHEFIENQTDEILEEINGYYTQYPLKGALDLNSKDLTALARHYVIRMKNPHFTTPTELHSEEKRKLAQILSIINDRCHTFITREHNKDLNVIADYTLLLCQAQNLLNLPEIHSTLQELVTLIATYVCNSEESYLYKTYLILIISESISDPHLKEQCIQDTLHYKGSTKEEGFQLILNLYFYHQFYLHTKQEAFKLRIQNLLNRLIYKENEDPIEMDQFVQQVSFSENSRKLENSIRTGLVLASILLGEDLDVSNCIL